jgi:2-methylisocitrate lyase-like PEP mutase family enzyme
MKTTTAMRALLAKPGCTMSVSAHDALLAKLVEQAGFTSISVSGSAVAAAYLGMPDMGFLNLSDMAAVVRRIAAAVRIPIIVDADTGYGNAMSVVRTVRELEQAGAAGIIIEDQIDYKKCGMIETGHPVIPAEEHAAKIRAASLARSDPDFIVGARTDAAHDLGLDEAIQRAFLYAQAGADLVHIEVDGTREDIDRIGNARLPVPLKASMDEGKRIAGIELSVLAEAGFRLASYPGLVRYTVVRAVQENLAHLMAHKSTVGIRDRMASVQEYFEAVELNRYLDMERDVLQPFAGASSLRV